MCCLLSRTYFDIPVIISSPPHLSLPSPLIPPQLCYIAQLDYNSVILLPQSSKWLNTSHCCCRLIPGPPNTSTLLLNYKSTASAASHKNNFMSGVPRTWGSVLSTAALGRLNHWHKFRRTWAREGMTCSQGQGLTQGKAKGRLVALLPKPLNVGVRHGLQNIVPPRCPSDLFLLLEGTKTPWALPDKEWTTPAVWTWITTENAIVLDLLKSSANRMKPSSKLKHTNNKPKKTGKNSRNTYKSVF